MSHHAYLIYYLPATKSIHPSSSAKGGTHTEPLTLLLSQDSNDARKRRLWFLSEPVTLARSQSYSALLSLADEDCLFFFFWVGDSYVTDPSRENDTSQPNLFLCQDDIEGIHLHTRGGRHHSSDSGGLLCQGLQIFRPSLHHHRVIYLGCDIGSYGFQLPNSLSIFVQRKPTKFWLNLFVCRS